ncbi:MAG: class I adenylate-forming enzyme family protein [Pseudomonadota bacterium]
MSPSAYESIVFHARLNPFAVAVSSESGLITYRQFLGEVDRVSRHVAALRIAPGSRVAVSVANLYLNWLIVLALGRLGLMCAMVQSRKDMHTLTPDVVLTDRPEQWSAFRTAPASTRWYERPADDLPPVAQCWHRDDDLAQIVLSSGTTGISKMVPVTFAQMHERTRSITADFAFTPQTRLLSTFGMSAAFGTLLPFTCWGAGGCVIVPVTQEAKPIWRLLRQQPTIAFMSTAQLEALVNALPAEFVPVAALRLYVAGSVLPLKVNRRARMRLTPALYIVYGSTETNTVAIGPAAHTDTHPHLTGYVLPSVKLEVVDGDGVPVANGTPGEVRIDARAQPREYLGDEQTTALCFRDGWFYPGDAAVLDNGQLSIMGRIRELMNLGGVKVSPEAVEAVLTGLAGVTEMAAFSYKGANAIDKPCLAVVAGHGFEEAEAVSRFAGAWPKVAALTVLRVDSLPRNAMGKVVRHELAAALEKSIDSGRAKN